MARKKKPAKPWKKLTEQQKVFVAALCADPKFNGKAAATKAGYSQPKTSAWELQNLPQYAHVQAAIRHEVNQRLAQFGMDATEWMSRACAMIKTDRRDLWSWDGEKLEITRTDDLTPEQALLIRDINRAEMDYGNTTRLKLIDPTPYFLMVAKALGLFRERIEIDASAEFKAAEESLNRKLDQLAAQLTKEVPQEPQPPGEESPPL